MSDPKPAVLPMAHNSAHQLAFPILAIPLELTHRILTFCHPQDVAAFSQTCRLAHELVQDEYLWWQIWHVYPFDDPQIISARRKEAGLITTPDLHPYGEGWKSEFTRRLKAELIATKRREHYSLLSSQDKKAALQVFVRVIEGALPASSLNNEDDKFPELSPSKNIQWMEKVLWNSRLIAPLLQSIEDEREISELQAHIRSCMDYHWGGRTRRATSDRRNRSRAFVYDLRNYGYKNDYGPYHPTGTVNWVHVEHLVNVVLANLEDLPHGTPTRPPSSLESLRPYSAPGRHSLRDWAGVEGTWRRYVCFMDYRDLFAFNYSDIADGPLHPKFFEDPRFREATRLIEVKLHVVPRRDIRFFSSSEIQPSASPKHPGIFFKGSSKGVSGNEASVEGYVCMAGDGTVRWRMVSIYDHSPQWSSNGVQLGDVGSARGVVGVWTTVTHEQGDPAGPFWLWKVEEDCYDNLVEYT